MLSPEFGPREQWHAKLAAFEPGIQGDSSYAAVMNNLGLTELPQGRILDIGTGPRALFHLDVSSKASEVELISLGAAIAEPDYRTVRAEYWEGRISEMTYSEAEKVRWRGFTAVAALAQQLPFAEQTFDMTISHAAMPAHILPKHYERSFSEAIRVTKSGGKMIFAPMWEDQRDDSLDALASLKVPLDLVVTEEIAVPEYSSDYGFNEWYRLTITKA